jgi:site-specific DNA recombinase
VHIVVKGDKLKLDAYLRVSRIGGRRGEGYISPEVQRDAIERRARELGAEVGEIHDDQDYSGGNMQRPAFEAALERLRSGAADGLIVKRVDRFARSVADGAAVIREIGELGRTFIACDEGLEHGPDDDPMTIHIHLTMAQAQLDNIKRGWKATQKRAIKRGAPPGTTPIGYMRIAKGEDNAGKLVPHPVFGPAITELFKRAATGRHSNTELARWFTKRAPHPDERRWWPAEIRRWLRSRTYLGEARYGDLVNTESHAPLTDPETWGRCQREPGTRRTSERGFLLTGRVRCANCRYIMRGASRGGRDGAVPVYRCSGDCGKGSVITAAGIEAHAIATVREHLAGLQIESAKDGVDLAELDVDLEAAEEEIRLFTTDVNARRLLGERGWQDGLAARAADRDAKQRARDEGYAQAKLEQAAALDVDALDRDALRDVLVNTIKCMFVRRRPRGASVAERTRIVWSDEAEGLELPSRGTPGPFAPVEW